MYSKKNDVYIYVIGILLSIGLPIFANSNAPKKDSVCSLVYGVHGLERANYRTQEDQERLLSSGYDSFIVERSLVIVSSNSKQRRHFLQRLRMKMKEESFAVFNLDFNEIQKNNKIPENMDLARRAVIDVLELQQLTPLEQGLRNEYQKKSLINYLKDRFAHPPLVAIFMQNIDGFRRRPTSEQELNTVERLLHEIGFASKLDHIWWALELDPAIYFPALSSTGAFGQFFMSASHAYLIP